MNDEWINNKIKLFANNPLGYLGFEEIHNSIKKLGIPKSEQVMLKATMLECRRTTVLGYLTALRDLSLISNDEYLTYVEDITCTKALLNDIDLLEAENNA